jgi:hypothetical protein
MNPPREKSVSPHTTLKMFAMEIDLRKLAAFLDQYAKPRWENRDEEWPFRPGGGESFIQDKVLAKGAPFLAENAIKLSAKESITNCLKCHVNLLSQFETKRLCQAIE